MVYPDQLEMASFRMLFRAALKHRDIGITKTMSAAISLHKVDGENKEGMLFTVHTEKDGFFEYWISQADIANINEHYPDLTEAGIQKDLVSGVTYVHPQHKDEQVVFTLYPTQFTLDKDKCDE